MVSNFNLKPVQSGVEVKAKLFSIGNKVWIVFSMPQAEEKPSSKPENKTSNLAGVNVSGKDPKSTQNTNKDSQTTQTQNKVSGQNQTTTNRSSGQSQTTRKYYGGKKYYGNYGKNSYGKYGKRSYYNRKYNKDSSSSNSEEE